MDFCKNKISESLREFLEESSEESLEESLMDGSQSTSKAALQDVEDRMRPARRRISTTALRNS